MDETKCIVMTRDSDAENAIYHCNIDGMYNESHIQLNNVHVKMRFDGYETKFVVFTYNGVVTFNWKLYIMYSSK